MPVVLRYSHWLRTMYGDRFHCASLLRFRALYQVLPMPHLDAATRAFYGVLVWGLSKFSPRQWEQALAGRQWRTVVDACSRIQGLVVLCSTTYLT